MQAYLTLVRRELGHSFLSWTGYVVISAVVFLLGLCFVNLLTALNNSDTEQPLLEMFYSTYYFWLILLLATPLTTMRSFALEKSSGTFETLMTTPVSDKQVVFAKFTGGLLFYVLMWLPLALCIFIVRKFSNDPSILDAGSIGSMALGILLLGCLYVSLGIFASSLTRNQIIAAMISFVLGISLFLLSFLSYAFATETSSTSKLFSQLSLIEHMRDFARGIVDTRAVIFDLTLTALFLFLTHRSVESRRWKS
jgi:ABC-2 type transport system permease protein